MYHQSNEGNVRRQTYITTATYIVILKHALVGAVFLTLVSFLTQCQRATSVPKISNAAMQLNATASTGDPLEIPVKLKLNGEYLKLFLVAYSSFKDDPLIPDQKKQIENYQIEFRQRGDLYFVLFHAKLKPSEGELVGGESELGKNDFKLIDKKFYK